MRKLFPIAAITVFAAITFSACKKSDNNNNNATQSMTATINGAAFNATICTATNDQGILTIDGIPSATNLSPDLNLTLGAYTGTGTYALTNVGNNIVNGAGIDSSATVGYGVTSGTVTVTSTSPYITGTFSFTAVGGNGSYEDTITIANGKFSAKPQ